ncbi:MAG: hypothetical protein P8M11_05095 [Planctomycetota bacterium]|nr:hypothetical protein [Planctomycetota bacterium]
MRSRAPLLALCLAFPSAASAPALPAAVSPPGVESVSSGKPVRLDPLDRRRIQRITEISAALLELDAEALDRAANTYRASAAQDLTLAIILRAGRPIPPGLAAARRAQRAARATEARAWLVRERESDAGRKHTDACIAFALSPGGDGAPSIPELEIAASFVVAELELIEQAPAVARLLDEGASAEVRKGARTALYRLYARSFETLASFEARWGQLEGRSPEQTGRDELREALAAGNERALALLELAPDRFDEAPLDWVDPEMAASAARTLGRAVAGGALDAEVARELLAEGLGAVADPGELHARLGVLIDLVQGADPLSETARSARAAVLSVAEASLWAGPDFVWVSLGALRRLQYPEGAEGGAERLEALEAAVRIFRGGLEARRSRPIDPDALQGAVLAIRDVARGVPSSGDRERGVRLLMRDLRALVVDQGLSLGVRRAAASSLTLSSAARDALQLVNLMQSPEAREALGYELLGALKVVAGSLSPGSEAAETVLDRLFEFVAEPDFDRRRLSLELLLSDEFAPLLAHEVRETSSRWTVLRLQAEPSEELRLQLLALLARIGHSETLDLLLAREGLVEGVIAPAPGLAGALCQAALTLNGGADAAPLLQLARRVAGPIGGAESLDPTRNARLRASIELVLGLATDQVAALPLEDSRWVVAAAVDLRRASPVLALGQLGASERATLRTTHLARLRGDPEVSVGVDGPLISLAGALLEADDLAAELRDGESADEAVLAARARRAERALGDLDDAIAAPEPADRFGWDRVELGLEGIELLRRMGRDDAAVARTESLFRGPSAGVAGRSGRAVRLLVAQALEAIEASVGQEPDATEDTQSPVVQSGQAVDPEVRARADLAAQVLLGLIGQEGWAGELPATQLGDLDAMLRLVQVGEDAAARAEAVAFLGGRMKSQAAAVEAWRAALTAADAEAFARLQLDLEATRAMVRSAAADSRGVGGVAPSPAAESPSSNPEEEASGSGDGA